MRRSYVASLLSILRRFILRQIYVNVLTFISLLDITATITIRRTFVKYANVEVLDFFIFLFLFISVYTRARASLLYFTC